MFYLKIVIFKKKLKKKILNQKNMLKKRCTIF